MGSGGFFRFHGGSWFFGMRIVGAFGELRSAARACGHFYWEK